MNEQSAHEQLSAYLDDELSPEERAVVESLLEESAAARQELAELRQVRELLFSLPPDSLSETFPAEVLHACEKRMLLDDVRPVSQDASENSKPKRSRFVWLGGLVASIAVVGITALWWNVDSPRSEMAMQDERGIVADRDFTEIDELIPISRNRVFESGVAEEAEFADGVALQDDAPILKSRDPSSGDEFSPRIAASEPLGAEALSGMAGASAPLPEAPMMATEAAPLSVPADTLGRAGNHNLAFKDDLKTAQVGEVVRALQRQDDKVIVVELTVVDRRQGLEQLQLLLARHRILVEESETESEGGETIKSPAESNSLGVSNQLMAVHVEAPSTQLQAALAELRSAAAVSEIKQRPSISPTQLAMAANFDSYSLEQERAEAKPRDKKDTRTVTEPAMKKSSVPLADRNSGNREPAASPDSFTQRKDNVAEEVTVALQARQRRLTVKNDVLEVGKQLGNGVGGGAFGASEKPASPSGVADADSSQSDPAKTAFRMRVQAPQRFMVKAPGQENAVRGGQPVQLLFVLVSQDRQPPPPPLPDDAGAA